LPYLSATADMCCIGSSCTLPSCPVKYRADSFKVVAVSDQTEEEIIKVKQALLEHGPMEVGYYVSREDYIDTSRNATVIATASVNFINHEVLLTGWMITLEYG